MIPQIDNGFSLTDKTEYYRKPNLTYKLDEKNINGKVDRIEAIKQSIYHILMTERYSNPIYGDDYGVELEKYIGSDIGTVEADIQETLRDALTQDDRITDVQVDSVTKMKNDSCLVEFTVYTIYGNISEELNVVQ